MLNHFFKHRKFTHNASFLALAVLGICGGASFAYAQDCDMPYEMVTRLHHPEPGSFTVWDAVYGEDRRDEKFISAINRGEEGEVLAVGEVVSLRGARPSMVFVYFDRRGRKVWDRFVPVNGLREIVKMLPNGDGHVVVANRQVPGKRPSVWVGFFDQDAKLKSAKIVADNNFDLYANDIKPSVAGRGYAIPVRSVKSIGAGEGKKTYETAAIYFLNDKGEEVASRAFILGGDTNISSMGVSYIGAEQPGYFATGSFSNDYNKRIGWILRLNSDGSLVWQKELSRGLLANLTHVRAYGKRYIVAMGDVQGGKEEVRGTWVMMMDVADGDILWQRYYYGERSYYNYSAGDMYVSDDGLIHVMIMARPDGDRLNDYREEKEASSIPPTIPDDMTFAQVLTLSPRGITLSGDVYFYGRGVNVNQMFKSPGGHRVLVGDVFIDPAEYKDEHETIHESDSATEPLIETERFDSTAEHHKGLTLLQKKLKEQAAEKHGEDAQGQEPKESAESKSMITQNGWVMIGDGPDTYEDSCD